MRIAATFQDQNQAQSISDYLLIQGIETEIRPGDSSDEGTGSSFDLWVLDDALQNKARAVIADYIEHPEKAEYTATRQAAHIRKQQKQDERWAKRNYIDARTTFYGGAASAGRSSTRTLIGLCVVLFVLQIFAENTYGYDIVFKWLAITPYQTASFNGRWEILVATLQQGQVWRLFTPILLHGGFIHILFNMLWLQSLGPLIEHKAGTTLFWILILGTGLGGNLMQYFLVGPNFLGMSGAIYGLLSFLYVKEQMGNPYRTRLGQQMMFGIPLPTAMLGWLVFGFVSPSMGMANWAHLGGLLAGVLAALLISKGPFLNQR